jgi:transposase
LITDGYEGYSVIGGRTSITHCGCWDHLRRKFHDIIKSRKKGAKPGLPDEALYWIGKLYDVEREARDADPHRRSILRNLYSRGIALHLEKWKDSVIDAVPPKSLLGKALYYMQSQWPKLIQFLEDGQIPLSNELAENAIRPFVLGRKAWLFSDTPAGAHASAAIYSLVETAKANDIEPYQYLRHVFEMLPLASTAEDVAVLLPWHLSLN